jgi:signal transduction histidine kinase
VGTQLTHLLGARRWALPGPIVGLLVLGAVIAFLEPGLGDAIGAPGLVLAYSIGAYLLLSRSRRLASREAAAWRFLGSGMTLIAIGVLIVVVLHLAGVEIPAFGPIDLFFLAAYGVFLVALYRLTRADSGGRAWVLTLLDALVGAVALGTLAWAYLYSELVATLAGAPRWEALVASAYPVLDIAAVILLMILLLRRSNFHWDARMVFLTLGIGVQVAADVLYLRDGIGRSFAEAEPVYWLFLLSAAFLISAAAIVDVEPRRREFPDRAVPVLALLWPYLLVLVLIGTHAYQYHTLGADSDSVLLLDSLLFIGGLALIRQVVVIRRHRGRLEVQRSELVASVSHELRTPLTAMVGYLALIEESGDDFPPEARSEMISEAAGQARHMARLVSDLVMLARGGNQSVPLAVSETAVSSIIAGALRGIDPESTLIDESFEGDALVRVDADRIRQALSNLIINGVNYGGDRVTLTGRVKAGDLVFEVHDNGPGLPVRHQTSVWERFERGSQRLNSSIPGMGIGLSIVKAVAGAHGGEAEYRRSELLGGACFSLTIPGCVAQSFDDRVSSDSAASRPEGMVGAQHPFVRGGS